MATTRSTSKKLGLLASPKKIDSPKKNQTKPRPSRRTKKTGTTKSKEKKSRASATTKVAETIENPQQQLGSSSTPKTSSNDEAMPRSLKRSLNSIGDHEEQGRPKRSKSLDLESSAPLPLPKLPSPAPASICSSPKRSIEDTEDAESVDAKRSKRHASPDQTNREVSEVTASTGNEEVFTPSASRETTGSTAPVDASESQLDSPASQPVSPSASSPKKRVRRRSFPISV